MQPSAELRKVQVTGGSTYVISLPKAWAKSVDLKPRDQVALIPQSDMSLLVVPKGELKPKEALEVTIDASEMKSEKAIVTEFIAHYLVGYDIIRVKLKNPRYRSFLRDAIRKNLIGVEIMEEAPNELVAQCLLGIIELPLDRALRRMHVLMLFMLKDAIESLKTNDKILAEEVVRRDDEVDRLYLFIVRQLKAVVSNRALVEDMGLTSTRDCLGYRLIVKSIERSADHASRIAKVVPTLTSPLDSKVLENLITMSQLASDIQENALTALYKYDTRIVHETIEKASQVAKLEEKIIEHLLELEIEARTIVGMRMILESIRRIAEYGTDIAEIDINLHVRIPA